MDDGTASDRKPDTPTGDDRNYRIRASKRLARLTAEVPTWVLIGISVLVVLGCVYAALQLLVFVHLQSEIDRLCVKIKGC